METISVDGENYVKASSIARELGYTSDYVGQLCRSGSVDAKMVGRSWYVSEESLRGHKKGRYRSSAAKSKSEIHKTIAERTHRVPTQPNYLNYSASYEVDESDLLPKTKDEDNQENLASSLQTSSAEEVETTKEESTDSSFGVAENTENKISITKVKTEEAQVSNAIRRKVLPSPKVSKLTPAVSARQNSLSTDVLPKPAPRSIFGPLSVGAVTAVLALLIVGGMLSLETQTVVSESQVSSVIGFDYQQTLSDLNSLQDNVFSP